MISAQVFRLPAAMRSVSHCAFMSSGKTAITVEPPYLKQLRLVPLSTLTGSGEVQGLYPFNDANKHMDCADSNNCDGCGLSWD